MHTINEKLKRIYIIKKLKISKQASMLYLQCFLCYCLRQYYWNPSASAPGAGVTGLCPHLFPSYAAV